MNFVAFGAPYSHHVTACAEVTLYEVKMSPQHRGVTCPHLSERGTIMWLYPLLSSDWWTAACSNYDEWFNNKTFMWCKQTWSVSGILCLFFSDRPKVATIKKPWSLFLLCSDQKVCEASPGLAPSASLAKALRVQKYYTRLLMQNGKNSVITLFSLNLYLLMRRRCSEIRLNYSWRPFYFSVCS